MNNMIKTLATGVALATLLSASVHAAFVPYTIAELRRDYPDLKPGFNDENLLETARLDSAMQMERDLNLRARWTGDEYARAEANERLTRIRLDYQVGPNFTRDQLVEASAARTLNEFIHNHGLSGHFTQSELILAEGRKTAVEYGFKGQNEPLGAREYAALAGKAADKEDISDWHLSEHWSFEELRATVGPEKAARYASVQGLKAGMTHAEIVATLGKWAAAQYAERLKISADFTADQAVEAAGRNALGYIRERFAEFPRYVYTVGGLQHCTDANTSTGEINEDWLLTQARAEALRDLQRRYPGLKGNFTEQQLLDYLTKQADTRMRETYGFTGPYEEYDVTKAMAESLVAEIRLKYKLPLHFTEDQLNAAMAASPHPFY
jgi:hypothetical protein